MCVLTDFPVCLHTASADNNKAETILELFVRGTQKYGVPSRARCDYGMENVLVGQFMLEQIRLDRGSITESSVHNCRVERTHRDVYAGVPCFYAQLFSEVEHIGILDPLSDLYLYCLRHVYLPRVNRSLQEFLAQMNNRPVSTEKTTPQFNCGHVVCYLISIPVTLRCLKENSTCLSLTLKVWLM